MLMFGSLDISGKYLNLSIKNWWSHKHLFGTPFATISIWISQTSSYQWPSHSLHFSTHLPHICKISAWPLEALGFPVRPKLENSSITLETIQTNGPILQMRNWRHRILEAAWFMKTRQAELAWSTGSAISHVWLWARHTVCIRFPIYKLKIPRMSHPTNMWPLIFPSRAIRLSQSLCFWHWEILWHVTLPKLHQG